jgi:hypothetical protein
MKDTQSNVMLQYLMNFGGFAVKLDTSASCSLDLIDLAHCSVNLVSLIAYKFLRSTWINFLTAFFSIGFHFSPSFPPRLDDYIRLYC